jgi:hypothetical protein
VFSNPADVVRSPGRDSLAVDTLIEKIAWHRRGIRTDFVGSLRAGYDGIRLTGRDPQTGLDLTLSIPPAEVEEVHVSSANGDLQVVVELVDGEPIILHTAGARPFQAQLLARKLDALLQPPQLLVQGG